VIRTRETQEAREAAALAPYATRSAEAGPREHPEPEDGYRTPFQRDRDRILHAAAFRSLQHKTQVFVVHEGDHYRTRLTHTLEVAQIARSIAAYLGANADLAEAVALAHDLGHAPFGHAGEDELTTCLGRHGLPGFDHNYQSLRIVTKLERRDAGYPGLNLCFATREGIARHETAYDRPAEVEAYRVSPQPGVEAQIANVADPLAYVTHDLEDALRVGTFFDEGDLRGLSIGFLDEALAAADAEAGAARGQGLTIAQGRAVRHHALHRRCLNRLIRDLLEDTQRRLDALGGAGGAGGEPDARAVRSAAAPVVGFSSATGEQVQRLRRFLHQRVYKHPIVLNMCTKGRRLLRALFEHFVLNPDHLPRSAQPWDGAPPPPEVSARAPAVSDFLASLTDRRLMDLYRSLFEPYERTLSSLE